MDDTRNVVIRHVLASRENLSLAVDIVDAFEAVQSEVIKRALDRLTASLSTSIGSKYLQIVNDFGEDPLKLYQCYKVSDVRWQPNIEIGLEPQANYAGQVIIGVIGNDPVVRAELGSRLTTEMRVGRASDHWIWYHYLDGEMHDWSTKEALLQLYAAEGGAVESIASEFKAIYRVLDEYFSSDEVPDSQLP